MQLNIRERFVLPTMIQDKGSLSEQMIMELFEGKFYSQEGITYKCTRNTE